MDKRFTASLKSGPAALDGALATLGWKGNTLASRLGVDRDTVSRWRNGKTPVPGYVEEYLRVMVLAKEMLDG